MNVCLVNDTSDDPNWGAIATSQAMRELIHEAGGSVTSTLYQYRIGSPQPDDTVDTAESTSVDGDRKSVADIAPCEWEAFDECAARVLDGEWFPAIYGALSECDVVLINGEGCIYDRTRQSRMIYFIAYLAKCYLGKPSAIVNHSIVMNDPVLVEIAANVYPYLDDIVFREPDSAIVCPGVSGHVGADAAYIHSPRPLAAWNGTYGDGFDPERPYACLGGGSVFFRGLRPGHDPLPGVMQLCERLRDAVGQIVLTASSHKDLSLMTPVSRELGLPLIDIDNCVQEAVDVLGHAGVYVGARWHPGIFAHRGGTPVIAWTEHTPKMTAFLKQAELSQRPFDPFLIGEQLDDIVMLATTYLDAGDELRDRLRAGAQRLEYKTRDNVRLLG
ncbi:polysaccharide pyruvyl transferase family protein [Aidingimonas lacisalsi]|uniref:polysaccharide pyruvyl transferase family protein n=1 Tax=Aidingimonas lacisalsi TaxID=2604086 RepID=UPI001375C0F1|nr:polysaccharide pyruvyl transferase family protein [Aidingimonas lacisalsi]